MNKVIMLSLGLCLLVSGCGTLGWGTAPPTQVGRHTYSLFVPNSKMGSGIAPGGGQLYIFQSAFPQPGQTITGTAIITSFQNPNLFSLLMSGPSGTFTLPAGATTSPANVKALYGIETPTLPVTIKFIPDESADGVASCPITINYSVE